MRTSLDADSVAYLEEVRATWAGNLRKLRKEHNMTQADLGALVDATQAAVSTWETGRVTIPPDAAMTIANHFGVDANETFGWPPAPWGLQRRRLPRAVAMAALEIAEWASAPAIVGNEELADDDLIEALRLAMQDLNPEAQALLSFVLVDGNQRVADPTRPPAAKKRERKERRRRGARRMSAEHFESVCRSLGQDPADVIRATGQDPAALESGEWLDVRALASALNVRTTALVPAGEVAVGGPTPRYVCDPWKVRVVADLANLNTHTVADTGFGADLEAVLSGAADGTWLFGHALAHLSGINFNAIPGYGYAAPAGWNTYGHPGKPVLNSIALYALIHDDRYYVPGQMPGSLAEACAKWAPLFGMTTEDLVMVLEKKRNVEEMEARRMWRVIAPLREDAATIVTFV